MTTIKAFTDLEQSKKLVEILPIESADMRYDGTGIELQLPKINYIEGKIPCWSLAALLGAIAVYGIIDIRFLQSTFDNRGNHLTNVWCLTFDDLGTITYDTYADNLIDACVNMIEKLHELN